MSLKFVFSAFGWLKRIKIKTTFKGVFNDQGTIIHVVIDDGKSVV